MYILSTSQPRTLLLFFKNEFNETVSLVAENLTFIKLQICNPWCFLISTPDISHILSGIITNYESIERYLTFIQITSNTVQLLFICLLFNDIYLGKTLISILAVKRHKLTIQIEFLLLQWNVTTLENQESLVRLLLCRRSIFSWLLCWSYMYFILKIVHVCTHLFWHKNINERFCII